MKTYKIKYIALCTVAAIFSGCEIAGLEFQKDTPYEYHVLDENINMTALEFMNEYREDSAFYLMQQGVQYAGLEAEYSKENRTFLFITNNSIIDFNNNGTVKEGTVFGTYLLASGDTAKIWEDYSKEEAKDIILYHIIQGAYGYENLGPENTEVTTLLDRPDNKAYIKIMNERNSKLRVNDFPFSVRYAQARSSNIHVTNGVVHVFDGFIVPWTE